MLNVVSVVSPDAYVVSNDRGDFDDSAGQRLFYGDTNCLSRFVIRIDGEELGRGGLRTRLGFARVYFGGGTLWRYGVR